MWLELAQRHNSQGDGGRKDGRIQLMQCEPPNPLAGRLHTYLVFYLVMEVHVIHAALLCTRTRVQA